MAWNDIKITIPGVGERAYIFSSHVNNNGNCVPNPLNTGNQCCYFGSTNWNVGNPLNGIYPNVGDWFTYADDFGPTNQCWRVLEIIDETMYNNGTCTACPPTSNCGSSCVYTINQASGIPVVYYATPPPGGSFTAGTTNNCSNCLVGTVVTPTTGNNPVWEECCGPHALLHAGRTTEVFIPTSVGSTGWILPDNNVIPLLPDDVGLPYCAFRGLNEPVSNGNLIVSPIDLWDDPQGWNQSQTLALTTNYVDVHTFSQYISQSHPYYDKMASQPLADFTDGIIVVPVTGHSSLTSIHPHPLQTNTTPTYQEELRGTGCECSGESTTTVFTCPCLIASPTYIPQADITTYGSIQNAINNLYGPTAYFNTHHHSTSLCVTNGCPDPNVPGNCIKVPLTARISNFGDPTNTVYGPLVWNGGSGWVSPYIDGNGNQVGYNYQQIVDWFNLVAATEGYAGGFTTAMSIAQLTALAQSQNTYTNQDYYNAQVNAGISTTQYNMYPQDNNIPTSFVNAGGSLCTGTYTTTTTTPETADVMFFAGFELIEKYITSPVSGFGTRTTNVLASGSWDNIRNFLYSCGMPNTITNYADARPWFEDNANSAAMGLQTVVNPLAYPDNAPNRVNIFNDVYLINKSLITRCPTGLVAGCTDGTALNYDPNATANCDGTILGTTNPGWNSCCNYVGQGCGQSVCWDCNPVTYTCFVDPLGPYTSYIQCATACTDCECIKVIGTGHSGTYHYSQQTDCEIDCCGGPSVGVCDVLIVGDDEGVLHYDVQTDVATHLFSDNSFDRYDIAAISNKRWVYTITGGGTQIKEYDMIMSPFSVSYNRTITIPAYGIGKGLTYYSHNTLLCANTKVQTIDISTNVGTVSTLFTLPGGTHCTGDLLYTGSLGSSNNMFIILYGTANTKKVGKFTSTGVLIQDSVIPSSILTGTTFFDSLFMDTDTNVVYGITNDARVYELLQTPILQFAPTPVHNTPIQFTNNVTKRVYGADNIQWPANMATERSCASGMTVPVTYNCEINPQLNIAGCVDPGNGTGTYTGVTALADCQNQTPGAGGCIITWNCNPASQADNCNSVQHYLPWPGVYDKLTALDYISNPTNSLQYTPFDQISFEGLSPQPGQCFVSTNGGSHPQWRIAYFKCDIVSPQPMYVWAYFINQCVNAGVTTVSINDTLGTVMTKINVHFNLPNTPISNPVIKIYQEPCICDHDICHCYPVIGSSGQYPTEAACDPVCCPPGPCIKCCVNKFGHQIQLIPTANPCKCPLGWAEIPCNPHGPCQPNVSCAPGYHWSYVSCRCVCDQQPCPWGWHWDEVNCNCSPNHMISTVPSEYYLDTKGEDITLARGDFDVEASAITTTKTLFTKSKTIRDEVIDTKERGTTTSSTKRYKLTEAGCVQCEQNQSEDYYTSNDCIYTSPNCNVDSKVTYYLCSSATNPVDGSTQRACIPQDTKPSSGTYYDSLEDCLNSGCAGFMWCEPGQSVNGVQWGVEEAESYSPIPMCCSSVISTTLRGKWSYEYTTSGPLTVEVCKQDCAAGETWYPLYNIYGTNVYEDSPLAYLTRELLLQVNIGQCTTSKDSSSFTRLGYTKKNPY